MRKLLILLFLISLANLAGAADIRVFVALADNKTQGIIPVPEKIGNGDDAQRNLYWGCDEALPVVFRASNEWKQNGREPGSKPAVIERITFTHRDGRWRLIADAYRGSSIRECLIDFIQTLSSNEPRENLPLVVYIGHNGLMEFTLPDESIAAVADPAQKTGRDAIVLCCMSERYFAGRLKELGARPVLTTTQLMYPGGFILRDALAGWIRGETPEQIRQRAATAYARNQGISAKAARGVFSSSPKR